MTGEGGGEGSGRGAESYDRQKAWSSINNSMLSAHDSRMEFAPPPPADFWGIPQPTPPQPRFKIDYQIQVMY